MPGAQVWEGTQQLLLGVGEGAFSVELWPDAGGGPRTQAWVYALKQQRPQVELSEDLPGWGVGEVRRPELNTDSTLGP